MNPKDSRKVGLARALSKLGYCSRSQASALIRSGRVRLNGNARRDPETPVNLQRDRIVVDGRGIEAVRPIYLMMNKPRGLLTTASDEKGRDTIYSILNGPESLPWLAPVGRLDKASEGLLLLTNDSEWGAQVATPETHLEKTYHAQIALRVNEEMMDALFQGVNCDGEWLRAKRAHLLRSGKRNCWIEIVLEEGKNRQIRRMMEKLGVEVLRLVRVAIGPLHLGTLAKGKYRHLSAEEKTRMDIAMGRSGVIAGE